MWWLAPIIAAGTASDLGSQPCLDEAFADDSIVGTSDDTVCFGTEDTRECVQLDDTGGVHRVPMPDWHGHDRKPELTLEVSGDGVAVCPWLSDDCTDVPRHYPDEELEPLAVSSDGKRALLLHRGKDSYPMVGDIISVATGKRLARFTGIDSGVMHHGHFLGANVVVDDLPAGPTWSKLIDPRSGRHIEFGGDLAPSLDLDERRTIIVDSKTVRIVDRIAVRDLAKLTITGSGEAPESVPIKVGHSVWIVTAGPAAITRVDLRHHRLGRTKPLSICR
jgi:hypothetical protein